MNPADRSAARGRWFIATCAAVLLLASAAAMAQDGASPARPFSVKLGAFFPTQDNLKNLSTSTWWAFGADWAPGFHYHPLGSTIHVGADINWHGIADVSSNVTSITGKLIWNITPLGNHPQVWGGVGAGLYYINLPTIAGFPTFGLRFILGVNLTDRVFVEADYDYVNGFTDTTNVGIRVDGVTIAGGFRF